MMFSENFTNLTAALVKAMGMVEQPKHNKSAKIPIKDKQGGGYKGSYTYSYTDLAGINAAIDKPFAENGLRALSDVSVKTSDTGHRELSVSTLIIHETGEWMRSQPIVYPAATTVQDLGGQITYLKRYSLSATLNLATEADDDANGASGNPDMDSLPKNSQGPSNANKGKQENGTKPQQAPAADPAAPKPATENQKKMIHAVIKAISDTQNVELEKVYPRIQELYKTDVAISDLSQQAASGLITELKKFEAGKSLY